MQAMACGLPVLTTPVGAIPEIVTDGSTGLMVTPRNADSLRDGIVRLRDDPGLRERLSLAALERARERFSMERMLDAMERMGGPIEPAASLLPAGQRLDLAVTVTDYYGAERLIHLHDPPVVREREHRQVLRFSVECLQNGRIRSDFGLDNVPALAFAARATSSYPGAFPPARVGEMDAVLAKRERGWPGRAAFIDGNFAHYRALGLDPEDVVLVDGSVLDNKPFHLAIEAVRSHTAFREVDRRLVYIDPHPKKPARGVHREVPGFFATIRGALSDLPRYDPINDELAWIGALNEEARRKRAALGM